MKHSEILDTASNDIFNDERICTYHITLYLTLCHLWEKNNFANPVPITRKKVMKLSHIKGIATYHKYINQLQEFGYIHYVPTYNPFFGSSISILVPHIKDGKI